MITTIELVCVGARDAQIKGTVVQTVTSATVAQPKDEIWSEVTLLEGPEGSWIVVRQRTISGVNGLVGEYLTVDRPKVSKDSINQFMGQVATEDDATQKMVDRVMIWLEHSFLAKELAVTQNWKVVEPVGFQ